MTPAEKLSQAALQLRSSNPSAWTEFLQALTDLRHAVDDDVSSAPPEFLPSAQGHAQRMRTIIKLLENAPAVVEKMKARKT